VVLAAPPVQLQSVGQLTVVVRLLAFLLRWLIENTRWRRRWCGPAASMVRCIIMQVGGVLRCRDVGGVMTTTVAVVTAATAAAVVRRAMSVALRLSVSL
jgi:hypothetical protein